MEADGGRRNERSSEHGRKGEKEMKKRIAACLIAMIWAVQPMTAFAEEEDLEVYSGIPFETVIAQPERVDQWLVYLNGVLKIEEEGMVLYYTEQDYVYDTRENAIWFPEREDYPIEEFLEDYPLYEDDIKGNVLEMGVYSNSIRCIMDTEECEGYAGKAYYLRFEDAKDKEKFEREAQYIDKEKRYDRSKEKEDPIMVSYYRLMGDPWTYDGRKVKLNVVYMPSEENLISANQEVLSHRGIWEEHTINGEEEFGYYRQMSQSEQAEEIQYMYAVGILGEKMHAWNTCMFYMDTPWFQDFEFIGYGGMRPNYLLIDLALHDRDIPRLMELKNENR